MALTKTKTSKTSKTSKVSKATKRDLVALAKAARERAARLEGELAVQGNPEALKVQESIREQKKRVNAYNRLIALREKGANTLQRKADEAFCVVGDLRIEQGLAREILVALENDLAKLLG